MDRTCGRVRDPRSLIAALDRATQELGTIEVLEYSPLQLIIPGAIEPGHPTHDPAVLAGKLWHLHTHPGEFRVFAEDLPAA